jgi:hypothetical protein
VLSKARQFVAKHEPVADGAGPKFAKQLFGQLIKVDD